MSNDKNKNKKSKMIKNHLNKEISINWLNKEININGIGFIICSLVYIYSSIFIFLLGWVKLIISIPTNALLLFFLIKYIKEKRNQKKKPINMKIKSLIILLVIVSIFGILFGWTGTFIQTGDWYKHNAVLADLTHKSWPVYYHNGNEESMLTYYLGQYIFPSSIGKIFGSLKLTIIMNGIWAIIGLFIATIGIYRTTKSNSKEKRLIAFIIIILFSVCTTIPQSVGKMIVPAAFKEYGYWIVFIDKIKLQLSSNPTLFRWVMPQVIIPWITLCILNDDIYDIKNYILIFLPVLFYSSFPFIGIIMLLFVLALIKFFKEKKKFGVLKELFSASNICLILTLGVIFISYFYGNIFSDKPEYIGASLVNYSEYSIIIYFIFILAFIPYTILLFKNNIKNPLYWISSAILLLIPFVRMGLYNDFVMRVSIVPLFIYMILCIKTLCDKNTTKIKKIVLILFLIIGSYSSIYEISNCFAYNKENINGITLEEYANRSVTKVTADYVYNYYSYDIKKNFFYKYIAK